MANKEHLAILKKGVEAWNEWRKKSGATIVPNLKGVDLRGRDLRRINLKEAVLDNTILSGADLRGANLSGAHIEDSNFFETDLRKANLSGSQLFGAKIENSIFTGAILRGVNFYRAKILYTDLDGLSFHGRINFNDAVLKGVKFSNPDFSGSYFLKTVLDNVDFGTANLEKAAFAMTQFIDVNLVKAKNLDSCDHFYYSNLSLATLKNNPNLPLKFLRGCGLSDTEIEFYKLYSEDLTASEVTDIGYKLIELRSKPGIQFYSCFISYSSKDEEFTRKLYDNLQNAGVRCWYAPEDLKIGDKFRNAIDDAIRFRDKLLVVLSAKSIESDWVENEVETALEEERERGKTVLFPIRIDNAVMETTKPWARLLRRERHIGDFSNWKNPADYNKAFERLMRDLKANNLNK